MHDAEETANERALREEQEALEGSSSPPEGGQSEPRERADELSGDGPSTGLLREVERAARQVVENSSGTEPGIGALREALRRLDTYEAGAR